MKIISNLLLAVLLVATILSSCVEAAATPAESSTSNPLRGSNADNKAAAASFASSIARGSTVKEKLLERLHNHRNLQGAQPGGDIPLKQPPSRECGQVISFATVDQIKVVASRIIQLLLQDDPLLVTFALSAVEGIIQYDVRAQVVCGSCADVTELYPNATFLLEGEGRHAFTSYCGSDRFAADITYSSLLLTPYDPATGEPVKGILKSHIFMKSYSNSAHAPSEYHIEDFDAWKTTNLDEIIALYTAFYDGWTSLFTASAGVMVVAPDYLGYGQSYLAPKGNGIFDLYQQAATISFMMSKHIVEKSGCTIIGTDTSSSGYSEGGAGAIPASLALEGLGQVILNVDTGGAPFRPAFQLAFSIDLIDKGIDDIEIIGSEQSVRDFFAVAAAFLSSKSPDLVNSNVGQNALNDEWLDRVISLSNTDLEVSRMGTYLPKPATDIMNEGFVNKTRDLLAQNITDACYTSIEGVDDLLCQAILENSYIDFVEATTFPISVCHSRNDHTIPYEHAPTNFSVNSLLTELRVFGEGPASGHFESSIFCYVAFVLQFSDSLGTAPAILKGIEPLPDPSTCQATIAAPTPTVTPTTAMAPATASPIDGVTGATAAPADQPSPAGPSVAPTSDAFSIRFCWGAMVMILSAYTLSW